MAQCEELEHPSRSRRVVGSNPIWGSDFSECLVDSIITAINFSALVENRTLVSRLEVEWNDHYNRREPLRVTKMK